MQLGLADVRLPKVPGLVRMISSFTLNQAVYCWLGASTVKPGTGGRSSLKVKIEVKASFRVKMGKRPELVLRRLRCYYFFNVSLSLTLANASSNSTHIYRMLTGVRDCRGYQDEESILLRFWGSHYSGREK